MLEPDRKEYLALKGRDKRTVVLRSLIASVFILLGLMVLVFRAYFFQVVQYEQYRVQSISNRIKLQPTPPNRGQIYDNKGNLIASNVSTFSLVVSVERVRDMPALIREVSEIIPISEEDLARFQRLQKQRQMFQPVALKQNLSRDEMARFAVEKYRFPDLEVRADTLRVYPFGELTAHTIGYVGRITKEDLNRIDRGNYAGSHLLGKNGIEKSYEEILHGKVGYQQVETNAAGRRLRVVSDVPPVSGRDLNLYLDMDLQRTAYAALGDYRGAVVAIDPRNGGVLAMVSKPGFDPNLFVSGISQADYTALSNSPDKPLFDRAARASYPPGSTIKPFISLAGLANGVVTTSTSFYCPGYFSFPGQQHRFRCWLRRGHGQSNMRKAIVQSCDVYFYNLANILGPERVKKFLSQFSFGERTGIDTNSEVSGLIPTPDWKSNNRKEPWYPGETLMLGIGQGSFLASPLQLAAATAAIANRGHYYEPRLVKATQEVLGNKEAQALAPVEHKIEGVSPQFWDAVIEDMAGVVESPAGSGRRIRTPAYRIAGKTGTAQVFSLGQTQVYSSSKIKKELRDHALFIAFAPVENPRIAVAVMVENGGGGGAVAAPIARQVIDAWLQPQSAPQVTQE